MINTCMQCGQVLTHVPGRRPKQFCNSTCRSKYWYKNQVNKIPPDLSEEMIQKKIAEVQEQIKHKPKLRGGALKPKGEQKTEQTASVSKPKNLEELKALCPPELDKWQRSKWISDERQKYGI